MAWPNRGGDTRIRIISSGSMSNPKADDIINIKLAKNIESSGGNAMINRGTGFVSLTNVFPYVLKQADIPPVGTARWPIIARALDLNLVSDPFYTQNPPAVPDAPVMGAATAGDGTASFAYSVPANGGSAITSYDVLLYLADGTLVRTLNNAPNPAVFTALTNGTGYKAKARAINAIGTGPLSAAFSATVTPAVVTTAWSAFTFDGVRSSASPARGAMVNQDRFSMRMINPATNTVTFDVAPTLNPNQTRNPPTSGFATLLPGQERYADGIDATYQWWQRVAASNNRTVTSATSTGLVVTVNLPAHGFVTGAVRAHDGFTPGGYNVLSQSITVIDADNYTYPIPAAAGVVTVVGYVYNSSESLIFEQGFTS